MNTYLRLNGGVCHSQSPDAVHLEPGRDDRHRIVTGSHLRRAGLMIFRPRVVLYHAVPVIVAVLGELVALLQFDLLKLDPQIPHDGSVHQFLHDSDRLYHDAAVVLGGQIVAPDDGRVEGVFAVQRDATCS